LERLVEMTSKMLGYCGELLQGGARLRVEYAMLLIKMTAINIFAIHHAAETYAGKSITSWACHIMDHG
jgi:hypothetical protein